MGILIAVSLKPSSSYSNIRTHTYTSQTPSLVGDLAVARHVTETSIPPRLRLILSSASPYSYFAFVYLRKHRELLRQYGVEFE